MLALWAIFLLSAMVVSWALDINTRLVVNGNASRMLEAEAMACSGAEIALDPMTKPHSSLLRERRGTQSFETKITGEGGRINLNWIWGGGDHPDRWELLTRYLELKGVELNDRERMLDCLLDWIDPDNLVRVNGAEADEDYRPANAPLRNIEEVRQIKGWEKFTSQPGWDADFTVVDGTGAIDLAWASRDVLLALGLSEPMVDQFLQVRAGPDGIEGTDDDAEFKTPADVQNALGLNEEQFKALAGFINFNNQVFRVTSVGRSSDVTRVVQMVFRKTGAMPQLIPGSWKEF